jgi:hypothetical protein
MNIILTALLAIGGYVHSAGNLIGNSLGRCLHKKVFGDLISIVLGITEGASLVARILLSSFCEIANIDIIGFGIGTNTGGSYIHWRSRCHSRWFFLPYLMSKWPLGLYHCQF